MVDAVVSPIEVKEANPLLIESLKEMLADAESGTLVGCLGVAIYHDGKTDDFWVESQRAHDVTILSDRIVGSLERCKFLLLNRRTLFDGDMLDTTS